MTKPFKFRYVNEIVGAFVLLVALLLLSGIFVVARVQGWLEPQYTLRIRFPPEGSFGVQKGAEVVILGTLVGRVSEVVVNDDGSMEGVLQIRGRFRGFIREDSEAVLKKKFGVAGDSFIEIVRGSGAPLPEDSVLPRVARKDAEIVELLQELVGQLQDSVLPILEEVRKAIAEYTGLAADLRSPDGHLQRILARIEDIAAGLSQGQGTAGKLLKDPATVDGVNEAVRQLNAALAELRGVVADLRATTEQLPETALQTRDTLHEAELTLQGLQRHWLLRGAMAPAAPPPARIPPAEIAVPGGR